MAHDFLGTFNQAMFDRLQAFIRSQMAIVDARIQHLNAEKTRIGVISFRYENGIPVGWVSDSTTYLGKLLAAYEVLGGNPGVDLRIRLRNDPVYLLPGNEEVGPTIMSNGEVVAGKGLNDQTSAILVQQLRGPFNSTVRRRFDYLERKIRRAVDYADQLQVEADTLTRLKLSIEVDGSLESLLAQVQQLLVDPTYRAINPDTSANAELGFDIYAPFSSYDVPEGAIQDPTQTTNRQAVQTQRQSGDIAPVKPGQRSA